MDAGVVPDLDTIPANPDPQRWGRAMAHRAAGGRSMMELMRRYVPYDGTKHTAATAVFGPTSTLEDPVGMPEHEVSSFIEGGHLHDVIKDGIRTVLHTHGHHHAPHIKVRVDITYTTRPATQPPASALHGGARNDLARLGGEDFEEIAAPHFYHGPPVHVVNNEAGISEFVNAFVDQFHDYIENVLPTNDSSQSLASLVSSNIWATPVLSARSASEDLALIGGSTRYTSPGAAAVVLDPDAVPTGQIDGQFVVPHQIFSCLGIVANDPSKNDLRCVARAIMTGLDEILESRSDTNVVVVLKDALEGALNLRSRVAKVAAHPTESELVKAKRAAVLAAAEARVAFVRTQLDAAVSLVQAAKRHIRIEGNPSKYRSRSRYGFIERNVMLAFRGCHPLIDFRDPLFATSMPINADTVSRIRACVKPGVAVRLQFWTVGCEDKVALAYPDPDVNLDFLMAGGRVVNIFFGYQHASYLVDVGACCNHKSLNHKGTNKGSERTYCGLCGFHTSRGNDGDKWIVYEHQRRGCPRKAALTMTVPMSYANRRQLGKRAYIALERPLVSAFYATQSEVLPSGLYETKEAALALFANTPQGWTGYSFLPGPSSDQWKEFRARYKEGTVDTSAMRVPDAVGATVYPTTYESGARRLWYALTQPDSVDRLLDQMHWVCPKDSASLSALPPMASSFCRGCTLPVTGWDVWRYQEYECDAVVHNEVVLEADDVEESLNAAQVTAAAEDVLVLQDAVEDADEIGCVEHHCHATGAVFRAHPRCNSLMRQSSSTLMVEVDSLPAMASAVEVLFTRAFIEERCYKGRPPVISKMDNAITRITFRVAGTPRRMTSYEHRVRAKRAADKGIEYFENAEELVPRVLTLTLRAREVFTDQLPVISQEAATSATEFGRASLAWAEHEFQRQQLWPFAFATRITYGRNLLYRSSLLDLSPGTTPTSLTSESTLQSLARMTKGGLIAVGERAEWFPLDAPLDRTRTVRLYLDKTAAYPYQFIRWKVPLLEHADEVAFDFSDNVAGGIDLIRTCDLACPFTMRFEISGSFAPELHAKLRAMPPVIERREVFGRDLSAFQRAFMGVASDKSVGVKTVNHLWPVDGLIVFARTAKILLSLGFTFTSVKRVWRTPATAWGKAWAETGERRRMGAKRARLLATTPEEEAKWAAEEDNVKLTYNSVVGSLNMQVERFTSWNSEKDYVVEEDAESVAPADRLTVLERYADDPRFKAQFLQAQDVTLFEMGQKRYVHTQSTLAALFIMEMARCDMLAMWYGTACGEERGILDEFPDAHLMYGCTDSLLIELSGDGSRDLRRAFYQAFHKVMDVSNVPAASTLWGEPSSVAPLFLKSHVLSNAGRWGCWKEETGMAGISPLVVNGPNRWGCRVVQSETDTPAKYKGQKQDILKSVRSAWKPHVTLEQFAAHWYNEELPKPEDLPPLESRTIVDELSRASEVPAAPKKSVALWGNRAAIVSRTEPYLHFPLGSQEPEALACLTGAAW